MNAIASPAPYVLGPAEGLADVWWKTGRLKLKADAGATGGGFSQVEVVDPLGTATPLHLHHDAEETFHILEGEVTLVVGDQKHELGVGSFALIPRGVPHAYLVRSDVARMLVTFSPSGFERVFADIGVPASDGQEPPPDSVFPPMDEVVRAFARYGCEILGPPPTL